MFCCMCCRVQCVVHWRIKVLVLQHTACLCVSLAKRTCMCCYDCDCVVGYCVSFSRGAESKNMCAGQDMCAQELCTSVRLTTGATGQLCPLLLLLRIGCVVGACVVVFWQHNNTPLWCFFLPLACCWQCSGVVFLSRHPLDSRNPHNLFTWLPSHSIAA